MRKNLSFFLAVLLCSASIAFPQYSFSKNGVPPYLIQLSATASKGQITLSWPQQQASTIYVYRDFGGPNSKPVATLLPSETTFIDKPIPGPHIYGLLVVGKDGRIAHRTAMLPVYLPKDCEDPSQMVIKLWINRFDMVVDCQSTTIKTAPEIINGSTFVSIRPIIEAAGGSLSWDGTTKTATVYLQNHSVMLTIGKNIAKVDGVEKPILASNPAIVPLIKNSNTMLPFRFIVESLGGRVNWDGTEKRIEIFFALSELAKIKRYLEPQSLVAMGEIGPVVKVSAVEEIKTNDPLETFMSGAKILVASGKDYNVVSISDALDPMGRKLSKTNFPLWMKQTGNVRAYKVSYDPLTMKIKPFTSVILVDLGNGDIFDPTLFPFLLEFGPVDFEGQQQYKNKFDAKIARFSTSWPVGNIFNDSSRIAFLDFDVVISGKISVSNPNCTPCARTMGEAEFAIKSICDEIQANSLRIFVPMIASLFDVSMATSQDNGFADLSLKGGCGFFPTSTCPDMKDQFAEMEFNFSDMRPYQATDDPQKSGQIVKGIFKLNPSNASEQGYESKDSNPKSQGLFAVKIDDSPKPKHMRIERKSNPKKFGEFLTPSLPPSLQPIPGCTLSMKVPILNTPSGRQSGIFEVAFSPAVSVTYPFERTVGFFGVEQEKKTLVLCNGQFVAQAGFECPCGELRGIEDASLKVDKTKPGQPKVVVDVRINPEVAFNPPESDVYVALFRNDVEISKQNVDKSNPQVQFVDEKIGAGEVYAYCIKLYQNGMEIDKWCHDETIVPNPWTISAAFEDGKQSKSETILPGRATQAKIKIGNTDAQEIQVQVRVDNICPKWTVKIDGKNDKWVTVGPDREEFVSVVVEPDETITPGDSCEVGIVIQSGLQKITLKYKITIESPTCSFKCEWEEGGAGITNDVSPGIAKYQMFTIKNTGSEQNKFVVDFTTDQDASTMGGVLWTVNFKDIMQGQSITIDAGKSVNIYMIVKASMSTQDGKSIKIDVSVKGCGETYKLEWVVTCKLQECEFDVGWTKGTSTRKYTTNPGDSWYESFTIINYGTQDMLFNVKVENEGEKLVTLLDSYEFSIAGGDTHKAKMQIKTPDSARIGEARLKITVTCGKTEKTLKLTVNIVKGESCSYTASWIITGNGTLNMDMPVDEVVTASIRIKNKSKKAELFAILTDRSDSSWESGFDTAKGLKQTFTLDPGEETQKLILWAKAGKNTKPGDACSVKVSVKACSTSLELMWNLVCVPHADLDVSVSNKVQSAKWTKDGSLAMEGVMAFTRQGAGSIKGISYQFEWIDVDGGGVTLGKTSQYSLDLEIYTGVPAFSYEHRVPKSIIDKLATSGSKRIKIIVSLNFLFKEETVVTKKAEFIVDIPPKTSLIQSDSKGLVPIAV